MSDSVAPVDRISRRSVLAILGGGVALALTSRLSRPAAESPVVDVADDAAVEFDLASVSAPLRYRGTATTDVRTTGLGETGRRSVEHDVDVTVAPPLVVGGTRETNPFDFRIRRTGSGRREGPDRLASASAALTPETGGERVVQHWDVRATGDRVRGTLRDPDSDAPPANNVLNTFREFVPGAAETVMLATESMVGGAELRGRITETDLCVVVSGNTLNTFADAALDRSRAFRAEIRATRVDREGDASPT